jgi:hypothetical protein
MERAKAGAERGESTERQVTPLALGERQAAEKIAVRANTLRKWRQLGIGPAYVRVSRRCIRYRVDAIEHFLREREVDPQQGSGAECEAR